MSNRQAYGTSERDDLSSLLNLFLCFDIAASNEAREAMDTEDSFKILRLRFLRPPPAFVTLPSENGSRKGWKVPSVF
jgi:hypothetical protein